MDLISVKQGLTL